jgi:hypothetical protein
LLGALKFAGVALPDGAHQRTVLAYEVGDGAGPWNVRVLLGARLGFHGLSFGVVVRPAAVPFAWVLRHPRDGGGA